MAYNVRRLHCSPSTVFDVLADGWLYPLWVVGASRMRDVDEHWPRPGARLHHSVGVWPALLDDTTDCLEWDPPHRLTITARGWPLGEARVTIDAKPHADGCLVRIQEETISGPALVLGPVADVLLRWRNTETLHRLAYVAEAREPRSGETTADSERAGKGDPEG